MRCDAAPLLTKTIQVTEQHNAAAAASSVGKVLDQIGEDFLTCVICFERYRKPKSLPCLHTFCEQCLLTLVENQGVLNCPTCKASCPLPHGGVRALTSNFFIAGLIEDFQARLKGQQKPAAKCDSCQEKDAFMRCVECSQYLCQPCVKIHKNIAVTRSHQILPIGELSAPKSNSTVKTTNKAVHCEVHPDKVVKFYCDTCQVPVCTDCTIVNHRIPQHVHRDLNTAAEEYQARMTKMLSKVELKNHEAESRHKASTQARSLLQERNKEAGKQLKNRTEIVKRQVRHDEEKLRAGLRKHYDFEAKNVDAKISEIEMELETISSTTSYLKKLMSHGNAAQLLSTKQEMTQRIERILSSELGRPFQADIVHFKPAEKDVHQKLGQLMSDVHISQCKVENIPKQVLKGEVIHLLVTTRDSKGKKIKVHGDIRGTVKKPDGSSENMKVRDARDGTYRLSTSAGMAGGYTITAMINGEVIEGTPIEIPVITGFIKVLGKKGNQKGEFFDPRGVSINRDGDIVTADYRNNRLQVLDTDGNCKKVIKYTHFENPFQPIDVAVSEENNLYYSLDNGNNQVVVSDMEGNLKDCFGHGKLSNPAYIAIHPLSGDLYIADKGWSERIKIFTKDGSYVKSFSMKGSLTLMSSVTISNTGIVFVVNANTSEGYIQMFDEHNKYLCKFGKASQKLGLSKGERGITFHKEFIYTCDNDNIIKYDVHGNVLATMVIREGLKYPAGLAVIDGVPIKIIVADRDNCCLKLFVE
ncbi:tripartite motif-containing protein 2-like [Ptychodera flava]|uniref:tripartite motif-containing protein 2-like n=1 Tax=Ptychodera flava TaxID=63121 RepID=UPI00396A9C82